MPCVGAIPPPPDNGRGVPTHKKTQQAIWKWQAGWRLAYPCIIYFCGDPGKTNRRVLGLLFVATYQAQHWSHLAAQAVAEVAGLGRQHQLGFWAIHLLLKPDGAAQQALNCQNVKNAPWP